MYAGWDLGAVPPPRADGPSDGKGAIDRISALDCLLCHVSLLRDVPMEFHEDWARAFTEVQDDLTIALDGGEPREIERSIKWYLCLHQVLLRLDDGHRGGRRALAATTRRFLEWEDGDYAKLLRDWERDVRRCSTLVRPARDEARTVRYATKLVEAGAVSKAMRILESKGLGDISVPRIRDQMARKHPQTRLDWDHDLSGVERIQLTKVDLGLTKLRRHAGTGVDRFPFEYLFRIKRGVMPTAVREAAVSSISVLGSRILNCDLPGWFYVLWTTPLLFAPYKDVATMDCRPVAAGIARRRFYGRCHGLDHVPATKADAEPVQLGSATPAGVQVMGIGLQLHLDVWKHVQVMIKLDFKNSFNKVERASIMTSARARHRLSAFVRYWETESRPRSPIFIVGAQGRLVQAPFDSVQGTQQGSEYGAKGHNAAYQDCFDDVNAFLQPHGGVLRADCDDCVIVAPPVVAAEAFDRLVIAVGVRGGAVQPTKSKAYATAAVREAMAAAGHSLPEGVAWGKNWDADGNEAFGLVVAGTPLGEPQFVLNYVTSEVQKVLATITPVTDKLLSASANDHALQCMRLSFRSRVNFLQQVVAPTPLVLAQYQRLDDALDDATARIMGLDLLRLPGTPAAQGLAAPEAVAQRARLPSRLGGTGHRQMADVAPAAYVGSIAMVIPRLPDRTDAHGDPIVGLLPHLEAVTGTGADFQRKYHGSNRFGTFLQQSAAIGIAMGTTLGGLWEALRQEVGEPDEGVMSVAAADLPGPPRVGLPPDASDRDVVFTKLQRAVTGAREGKRREDIERLYATTPLNDPANLAFRAGGPTLALVSLPNSQNRRSPRELVGDIVTLYGTADPELLAHEGKPFMDRGIRRTVDVYGHSLSLYTGTGSRRQISHDIIVRRLESMLRFAGQHDVMAEDVGVFKDCILSRARRERYLKDMGRRSTRRTSHGMRPDIRALMWPFAQSPVGPSQLQLWDVKTVGVLEAYAANFRVPPADQRARGVPADYRRIAVECDQTWNETPAGTVGAFEGYLGTLPPVIGLGFGAFGEWSMEVNTLIGQIAEIASVVPERIGCCHGPSQARGRYAHWARTHLHRECLRETTRCRHAALDRMLHRPTETYAGDPELCRMMDDSPDDPGVSNAWDSSGERGTFGGGPNRGA